MRLLIVSNRLPITVENKDNNLVFKESSGGLVSGLSSYLDSLKHSSFTSNMRYIWVGWPGIEIDNWQRDPLRIKVLKEYNALPVFLSETTMENFYQGFCNKTIWPLFHYFPTYAVYNEEYWECYKSVNETFFNTIMEILQPDDIIWIHDYHLMLLPKMIKNRYPGIRIGFFLHIPFPTYEIFNLLPGNWSQSILEGILGADIVGFHTFDYTQYFLRCILRILGIEPDLGSVTLDNHKAKVDTFPMGIDFLKFQNSLTSTEVENEIIELKKTLNYKKVILSIDRLDYTKGIINRLQAYEIFLAKNADWHEKVILILYVVPSRIGVDQYLSIKRQIDEFVGQINGKFGSISWTPISYKYGFIPFNPLVALYAAADILLVTPLRDGMNLISKEYLACRKDKSGVLILSEMAGSSKELGEALIINPNNKEEIASAIKEAVEMPENEQIRRNEIMQSILKRYDVVKWADDFIQRVINTSEEEELLKSKYLNNNRIELLLNDFTQAKARLILLDYDGTLVPFTDFPEQAKPGSDVVDLLNKISLLEGTDCIIISGRDKNTLEEWFGMLNIGIIAEHGALIKKDKQKWETLRSLRVNWKPQIFSIFEIYRDRLPGSFIEEKEFSLALHYRKSDPEIASIRAKEIIDQLLNLTANIDIQVLKGNKVVEVRNSSVNKGIAALKWITERHFDFIMAIGDDWTDEDLFKVLPDYAYSIKVGITPSHSRFSLSDTRDVLNLLKHLTST